jgi:hypothetical protein
MSKKVVAFALPQALPQTDAEEPALPFERRLPLSSDNWVTAAAAPAPEPASEAVPAFAEDMSPPGPALIDLSRKRSFTELMELMWVFPWLASWAWTLQMSEDWFTRMRLPGR